MVLVLILVLLILAVGGLPHWGYSQPWGAGYYPSSIIGVVILVLLILLLVGRI